MAIAPATARRWWMQSWEFSSAIFLVLVSVRFLGYRFAENGRPPFAVDGATGFFQVLGDLVPNSEFWGVMVLTGAGISVATIFAPVGWRVVGRVVLAVWWAALAGANLPLGLDTVTVFGALILYGFPIIAAFQAYAMFGRWLDEK